MQAVSSTFNSNTTAISQYITYGIQIAWQETINSSFNFFTIGTSTIGGPDTIKGTGTEVTFLDRYQYTDYSTYGLSIDINRNLGLYPYGTIMAQAEVKLDNTSLLFMPHYDPTIGNYILPNRPIRLTTGLASDSNGLNQESIMMFSGYGMAPNNDVNNRETIITAYDLMNYLNNTKSTGSGPLAAASNGVYINTYAHLIIADLLTEAGLSSTQYVIEQSLQQPIGYLSPINFTSGTNINGNEGSIGYIISALCEAEMGIAFADEAGVFHFWNRQHIPDNTTPQWSFDYSETLGGNNTGIIGYSLENTAIINDVIVQSIPRAVFAKQLLWQLSEAVIIPAGSSATVSIDFTDDNGALPVTTVDTPTLFNATSSLDSSYQVNAAADGSSSMSVNGYITVGTVTLKGSNCQITFNNSYSVPIYLTSLNIYGTPAKVTQPVSIEYKNPTSIALNGVNPSNNGQPLQISNDLIQDNDTANSIAYQLVNDYSSGQQRMLVEVMAVPQLQFGDYVTTLLNDVSLTQNYTVIGLHFSQTKQDPFRQQLELEVKVMVTYFTIGVSQIGSTDAIAP